MPRTLASAVGSLVVTAIVGTPAIGFAADAGQASATASSVASVAATAPADQVLPWYRNQAPRVTEHRPAALPALYVSLGVLQAADVYTTRMGLRRGAAEANPMLSPAAGGHAAMVAVKIASTAGTIALSERLWKANRAAAIALMVGVNGTMAAVAARNVQVIRGLRK